jgi:hypothetical protein
MREAQRALAVIQEDGPTAENDLDLYASDSVHTRLNALRGLLLALVEGSEIQESPLVSWTDTTGEFRTF